MTPADRLAMVTGANRGIGLEVVRQLAHYGITVILGSRNLEKGEMAAARLIDEGLPILPRQLDVTDSESIARLAADVEQEYGRLDILVNNAGVLYDIQQQPSTANLDTVQEALNTQICWGPGGCVRHCFPYCGVVNWAAMLPDDGPTGGFFRDGKPIPW